VLLYWYIKVFISSILQAQFYITGVVHLTGYLVEENPPEELEYEGMTSSEEQESDEYSSEEGRKNVFLSFNCFCIC